ncbi:MAG: glycerophosphodiester phosphodiesterase, partial [Lentisphaeria bacterium]
IGYWGDGNPAREKMNQFRVLERQGFASLDQVQLHLEFTAGAGAGWPFDIAREELAMALAATGRRGVALQVFPWNFDAAGIHALLDLGLQSFATDEPARFTQALTGWAATPANRASNF